MQDSQPRRRAQLMAALALVLATGGFVRSALPVLSTFIIADLDLTTSQFGLLLTVFLGSLTLSAPVSGRLVDWLGGRRLLAARYALVSVALVAASAASSYPLLLGALVLAGLSLGGGNPGTNKIISRDVPPGRRGIVMGVKQSGGQVGVLLAGVSLPSIALASSWRLGLATGVIVAVLGLIALFSFVPADPADDPDSDRRSPGHHLNHGLLLRLSAIGFAMGAGVASFFGFLPLYANEVVGMSPASAGGLVSLMAASGAIARIQWSRVSERSARFTTPFGLLAAVSSIAVGGLLLGAVVGSWVLWPSALIAGLSLEAWNAVGNLAAVSLFHGSRTGSASGIMMFGFIAGGAASPVLFGLLVDGPGYWAAWLMVMSLFFAALAMSVRWRRDPAFAMPAPVVD